MISATITDTSTIIIRLNSASVGAVQAPRARPRCKACNKTRIITPYKNTLQMVEMSGIEPESSVAVTI